MQNSNITIALPVSELRPALTGLGKVMSRSRSLPVLGTIKVARDSEGWIHLTASDLDTFVSVRLEEPSAGEPACALVPHAELSRLVKNQADSGQIEVVIAPEGEAPSLRYPIGEESLTQRLELIPMDEFPESPAFDGEEIPFGNDVRESLLQALNCASKDETRFVLQGAFLDTTGKDGHHVIGTDGHHLYSANSFKLPLPIPVIIPERKFLVWRPFAADGEWRIALQLSEDTGKEKPRVQWLRLTSRRWSVACRSIDGNYPNYRQVIPPQTDFRTEVDLGRDGTAAMLEVLKGLPGAELENKPVTFYVNDSEFSVSGVHTDGAPPTRCRIPAASVKGQPVIISVNREFAAKALSFGMSRLQFIDPMSPMRFSTGGREMIVMPIRTAVSEAAKSTEPEPVATPAPEATPAQAPDSTPVPAPEPTPTTTTPAHDEPQQQERNPMIQSNDNAETSTPASDDKAALDSAIEKLDALKVALRFTLTGANEVSGLLKQAVRDQRIEAKEIQSVRQTLRTLQGVKL